MAVIKIAVEVTKDSTGGLKATVQGLDEVDKKAKSVKETLSGFGSNIFQGIGQGLGQAIASGLGQLATFSTQALSSTLALAGGIQDLSDRYQIGAEALQVYKAAGQDAGVEMETFAKGVVELQKKIGSESAESAKSLSQIGLTFKDLKGLAPEKQLQEVLDRISKIPDPAQRTAVAFDILGKAGPALVPLAGQLQAIEEHMRATGQVMSGETIAALDALGDQVGDLGRTWDGLKNNLVGAVASSQLVHDAINFLITQLGNLSVWVQKNQDAIRGLVAQGLGYLVSGVDLALQGVRAFLMGMETLEHISVDTVGFLLKVGAAIEMVGKIAANPLKATDYWKEYQQAIKDADFVTRQGNADVVKSYEGINAVVDKAGAANRQFGEMVKTSAQEVFKADDANKKYAGSTQVVTKGDLEAAEAAKKRAAAIKEILDSNAKAMYAHQQKETKSLYDSLEGGALGKGGLAGPIGKVFEDQAKKAKDAWKEGTEALARGAESQLEHVRQQTERWGVALQGVATMAGLLGGKFGESLTVVQNIGDALGRLRVQTAENAKLVSEGKMSAEDAAHAQTMGRIGMGAQAVGMIGGLVGGKVGGFLQGAGAGAQIGSIAGPYGAAIGAVVGGIVGLFKKKHEEMVKQAQQAGVDIANAIAKGTDAMKFVPALLKDKKTALATFDQLGAQFEQAQAQYKAAILESTKGAVGGLTSMIAYLGTKTGDTTADFQRMGTYVMGIFGSLRKQGMSFVDAVAQMRPALDALTKQAADKGQTLTGGAADLAHFSALIDANQELVTAAEGAGKVLEGLRVSGSLTQETFSGLQTDVMGYITSLGQAGFAPQQALAVAAPSLYQLKKAHDDLGLSLDANTQKAIDDAAAQGLFAGLNDPIDEMKKSMDAMVQVMAAIAQAFHATLPAAVQDYINSLNKIPTVPVPGGGSTAGTGTAPGATGGVPHPAIPGHASGLDYVPRGPLAGGGSLHVLHPEEAVLNAGDAKEWRAGKGGDRGSFTYHAPGQIIVQGSGLSKDELADAMIKVMRDNEQGAVTRMRRAMAMRG